ncbi:MAG: glycosyltransferase [bacterium]
MNDIHKKAESPYVSIIIPMRNEEKYIAQCISSILNNDYPQNRYEIIVVDGMSTDNSQNIVREMQKRFQNIRLLENPSKIRASANNIGIRAAKGEIIISMDAHVIYASDYIHRCVELLQTTDAANVGGIQKAVGHNYLTRAIAFAITTPLGVGNAEFRYSKKSKWVDTVYLGAWHKKTLEQMGLFNENWGRNADYELNYRIRKVGGKILLSPDLKCEYLVRNSLFEFAKQYFHYGVWRVKTILTHPESIRWRHLIPPLLVVCLFISIILLTFKINFGWIPFILYSLYTLGASFIISVSKGLHYFPLLTIIFWIMHLSWGIGFINGIFKFGFPRIKLKTIIRDFIGKISFN